MRGGCWVVAMGLAIAFHLTNSWLFIIGVFPWFMLLSLPIFLDPGCLRKRFLGQTLDDTSTSSTFSVPIPFFAVLVVFVSWQLLFPLRHFAIPGNPSWTEEGHYFAWHMLVRGKRSALRYIALDRTLGSTGTINLRRFVTEYQLSRLSRDPRMIHELAQLIVAELRSRDFSDVELRAHVLVSMNGRRPQLLIDPSVDLAREQVGWRKPSWIVPLVEPLRSEPWRQPITEWEPILNDALARYAEANPQ